MNDEEDKRIRGHKNKRIRGQEEEGTKTRG
jgi:hypothetical protein